MIIQWNQPNLLTVYVPAGSTVAGNPGYSVGAKILPGMNEIPDDQWEVFKKKDIIKNYLRDGALKEIGKPDKDNKKARKGLAMYDLDEAVMIVKGTFDHKLLSEWKGMDNRQGVLTAIETQFKTIEEKTKKVETSTSDDDDDE